MNFCVLLPASCCPTGRDRDRGGRLTKDSAPRFDERLHIAESQFLFMTRIDEILPRLGRRNLMTNRSPSQLACFGGPRLINRGHRRKHQPPLDFPEKPEWPCQSALFSLIQAPSARRKPRRKRCLSAVCIKLIQQAASATASAMKSSRKTASYMTPPTNVITLNDEKPHCTKRRRPHRAMKRRMICLSFTSARGSLARPWRKASRASAACGFFRESHQTSADLSLRGRTAENLRARAWAALMLRRVLTFGPRMSPAEKASIICVVNGQAASPPHPKQPPPAVHMLREGAVILFCLIVPAGRRPRGSGGYQ